MAISRVIEVSFGRSSVALVRIDTAYFYNNGIIFKPTDIELPTSYQVHWADSPQASSTLETIGTAEGAPIPDDLWNRSRVIYGWIYLHPTEDSGVTGYEVRIYKNVRAGLPDGTEPTPAEQSTIDQLISALNTAVEQTGEDVESAEQARDDAITAKTAAESARDTAGEYANDAESSAASASTSASQASASATASAQSASASAQIKSDIEGMVDDAQSYAESALIASQASVTARDTAQGYAQSASASAQSASTSASNASASAQTASAKASEASTSAQTASAKAAEASQSASQALGYKTDAESAKTASQTAQTASESARDSAISAKNDAESARDDAVQAKEDAESAVASISGALAEKAPVITDTASGSIASFSDGADDLPLKSLVVNIDPVQDLHGQDAPYPAGGGKNKFDPNSANHNWVGTNGVIAQRDMCKTCKIPIASGTSVTLSNANASSATNILLLAFFDSNDTLLSRHPLSTGATYITATAPENTTYVMASFFTWSEASYAQLELGSTATSWSPYENICPISGWTQIDVNHSGADMTNPTTITINLGQTVYGAKLYPLEGKAVIDRGIAVFNGTENFNNNYFPTIVCSKLFPKGDVSGNSFINSHLPSLNMACNYANSNTKTTFQFGKVDEYWGVSSADELKAIFAQQYANGTPVTICYPLAEPIEIQLTPNQINSLLGVNNLWADSGDTEVEYRADTKLFIERLTAPDSADMIADANITSGKYFMVGNSLYKATANIANGGQIIVGTNCTRKSLSEALNEINA